MGDFLALGRREKGDEVVQAAKKGIYLDKGVRKVVSHPILFLEIPNVTIIGD